MGDTACLQGTFKVRVSLNEYLKALLSAHRSFYSILIGLNGCCGDSKGYQRGI